MLVAGEKLAAIKLYRKRDGASLAEAKLAVESIDSPPKAVDSDLEARVVTLLRKNPSSRPSSCIASRRTAG